MLTDATRRAILAAVAAVLLAVPIAVPVFAQDALPACTPGQPSGDPITVTGTGQKSSAPFSLAGGAYVVDWTMAPPSDRLSFITLRSATDPSVLRSETILNGGAGAAGQTHVYTLKPGTYYLDVRAPAGWTVTLTPITV